ncbi:hypothetical protein J4474_03650 [Candidatus Pacearchaeota archaeon]|nr:hypothetical protein [Candidatus Pacearchaeota archaeon]
MKIQDFAYIVETEKNFDEAVISVLKSVEKKSWSLFQVYDIKERLEPTHYSLDVRFAERVSNYYTRYSIFANFYRRDAK